ncbi:MAG: glycosyltransferase [Pseudomonadota bacterium]
MLRQLTRAPRRLLITSDAVGGIWRYTLELTRELVRQGDIVTIAGLGPHPSARQAEEAMELAEVVWLATRPDWLVEAPAELDGFAAEIEPLLRERDIDVVQLNAGCMAAGLDARCPVIVVSHSCIASWFKEVRGCRPDRRWSWHYRRTKAGLARADIVVTPSASHGEQLCELYGPLSHLTVVHNGIAAAPPQRSPVDMIFAAARWWDPGKNAAVLDAAAELTHWPIFAAGDIRAPHGEAFEFHNAISLGSLPHGEVQALMGRTGIFVSPSLYEPFGLAALEAASSGAALVLADIPTYRELWRDSALFFPPRDAAALAAILNSLAADEPARGALAEAAKRRSHRFTSARQAAEMRSLYDAVCSQRERRA